MFQHLRSLEELQDTALSYEKLKHDHICEPSDMAMTSNGKESIMRVKTIEGNKYLTVTEGAHRQLALFLGISSPYYFKMAQEAPELLDRNVNTWLHRSNKTRMIRAYGNTLRSLVSNRYRRIDNLRALAMLKDALADLPEAKLAACSVTPDDLFAKFTVRNTKQEVRKGDIIVAGFALSNNECGWGQLKTSSFTERLICTNGAVIHNTDGSIHRKHLGKVITDITMDPYMYDDSYELQERVEQQIKKALDPGVFNNFIDTARKATEIQIAEEPLEVVSNVCKVYNLTEAEQKGVLYHYMVDHDYTLYGLFNAVSRAAQDSYNMARATLIEQAAGKLLHDAMKSFKHTGGLPLIESIA